MVYADPMYGQDLVNSQGYTLYIFKNDTPGTSNCTGNCAAIWPPLTVSSGETPTAGPGVTGTLGTIQRSDGSMQVTINDLPLYTYSGDTQAGTAAGQGYKNLWYVLAPDGTPNTTNASSTGTPMAAPMATSTP